jgi:hypothetical protein
VRKGNKKTQAEHYKIAAQAMADHFSRIFVHRLSDPTRENKVSFGVFGDSVTAAQDNCFYDAWPNALQRQLAPLFKAAGLEFEVRMHAFNGGYDISFEAAACMGAALGADVDLVAAYLPFVVGSVPNAAAESIVRSALRAGALPSVQWPGYSHSYVDAAGKTCVDAAGDSHSCAKSGGRDVNAENGFDLDDYYEYGATAFLGSGSTVLEGNAGHQFHNAYGNEVDQAYWGPHLGQFFWGQPGNGLCKMKTRSGSSAVIARNWHGGPLIYECV